jgi:hypothetical protein
MTDPTLFPSATPRFGLPLLFAGQAQKETFVNEALALTDALMHCVVEGQSTSPPTEPADGTVWLVASGASGDWTGHDCEIACRQGGNWLFVTPVAGMRALNRSSGQSQYFSNSWIAATIPLEPIGGSTVDVEARAAIAGLVAALRSATVFPST